MKKIYKNSPFKFHEADSCKFPVQRPLSHEVSDQAH